MVSSIRQPAIFPSIEIALNRLRQLNTQDIQSQWQQSGDTTVEDVFALQEVGWAIAPLNDRQHITWRKGYQTVWLYQSITVPNHLYGYPLLGLTLRLALTWWADDAQIYVDGTLAQSGDLFECLTRICLSECVTPGQTFQVAIRLISPGHDDGALVRSHLTYELPAHYPTPEPSFVADELTVLATLEPDSQMEIEQAIARLNWNSLKTPQINDNPQDPAQQIWEGLSAQTQLIPAVIHPFQQSLSELRRKLLSFSSALKQRQIQCVGHAHLDMAWLWPISDTWDAAERTFKSILNLQKDFPELTYTHSSPALFEWIENNRPELFQQIQQKVSEGSWTIDAGLWIEPEFNLISGESIVRQILYGQRYCQEKFGQISKVAWLPDSFGFCWQLPQILTQGGIETFATLKLSWNDTTEFPHQLFWWQSPDGSRILSIMLPPIGSDIDPVKMATQSKNWETSTGIANTLWLPGLGDHGGGPTQDMLEKYQRWERSPFFPTLKFTSPNKYINRLPLSSSPPLPIHRDELYLELHRGCYTTHADQKQNNRQCEDLLYQAEVFATIAYLTANVAYPKADIEIAWKALLFNQFHDILPGTSIPEVFVEANEGWKQVKKIGQRVLDESLDAIASTIQQPSPPHLDAKPLIVFNPLTWPRDAVITFDLSEIDPKKRHLDWIIYNSEGQTIPNQDAPELSNKKAPHQVSFLAANIPALGYQHYWIYRSEKPNDAPILSSYVLENKFIKASISPLTGQINSLIEKITQKEIFSAPGNQLQMFRDQSGYWDAWNIAADYEKHPLPQPELFSIVWHETGPIRQCIRTVYETESSTICQDYILEINTPFLIVKNHILWQEEKILLKVNFPLTTSSNTATYEIPFGAITRTTNPQTDGEKAQWEVPALRWADMGDKTFGVSILTQGKHGFDASPNHLRLTLLKAPIWPDPKADRGTHQFTYAIYPHPGTWKQARTVHHARELNIVPIARQVKGKTKTQQIRQFEDRSFLEIHNDNVILSAFKPAEDNPNGIILRCYEAHGEAANLSLKSSLGMPDSLDKHIYQTNLLEAPVENQQSAPIEPWQISTYRLNKERLDQ
ncbi:MAG: alpha-mannosidase [Leptolyngbya foveolarum]|uniref:Alpha-mannosidase n=1 Tax=Leptolyngbya foveolarum TaxID=47253 RepID=A0A2W4UST8_9CYAN|nr:MAG: alpha-mannosidase [Leptolyngbya foveolarum]